MGGGDVPEGREFDVVSTCLEVWDPPEFFPSAICSSQIQAEAESGGQTQREVLSLPRLH